MNKNTYSTFDLKARHKAQTGVRFKNLFQFIRPYKKQVILGPLFKLMEAIFELLIPTIMILITDKGISNKDTGYILKVGLLLIFTALCGTTAAFICQYFAAVTSQGFGTRLRNALFEKINTFSYSEIDYFGTPSLINRITNDVNQLQLALAMIIRQAVRFPFLCIGGVIMATFLDFKLSTVLYLSIPFLIFSIYLVMSKSIPLYAVVQKKLDKLALILREHLSGVRVIRAFSMVEKEQARFEQANTDLTQTTVHVGKISALMNPITSIIMNFALIAVIWFGGVRVNNGAMTTGKVIAYITYINLVLSALIMLATLFVLLTKATASASRVNEILSVTPAIQYRQDKVNNQNLGVEVPLIEFDHVTFSYPASKKETLSDISFTIKRGQRIGIIGGTGSGKTTLINLIPRLYDTTKGHVFINGIHVKDYSKEAITQLVGVVPQKAVLFSGTILENIRWGNENATEDDVRKAAQTGMASEFIEQMPQTYHTSISQGGANFSGGQKQRLTIARALVKNPEILIMDDSLSALDYATDASLRHELSKTSKQMTVIMVTQRISTIKDADFILVMEDGHLVNMGTHEELLQHSSVYREICNSQSQNIKEGL